jgi:hypothetical protein
VNLPPRSCDIATEGSVNGPQAQDGVGIMLKLIAAVSGAALLATTLVFIPGATSVVQAHMYSVKGDRLDLHAYGSACSERSWPYFEASCLRNTNSPTRQAPVVRIVGTDRLAGAR